MVFLYYAITAAVLVFLSIKASKYVDLIDKKTKLSGALIGGMLLSAVTSFPELVTSVSATVWLKEPGLCMGNILGSDLFNLMVLGVLILFTASKFKASPISKSHTLTTVYVFIIYAVIALNLYNILNLQVFTVSVTSIIILVLYILGVRNMAKDTETEPEPQEEDSCNLSLKQIIIRFSITSVGLIVFSIIITYFTDIISEQLNLGTGLAGAIFLGIATSLPEVVSCITLIKIGNYNIAVGNIVGSNIFNFLILTIADVLYVGGGIYNFDDPKTFNLLVFGGIATVLMGAALMLRKKLPAVIPCVGIIACYVLFLVI